MLSLFGATITARADEGDGFQAQARISMAHDDNLFSLSDPSAIPPGAPHSGATWIQTETADLSFNRIYGLQSVSADVSANHYTYSSLHYLDYNAVNYNGLWRWQLGTRLNGTIGADREKTLGGYSDFHDYSTPNLITHTGETLTFDWNAVGRWHLVGGVIHAHITSPSLYTQIGTFYQTDFQLGAGYVSGLGNSVTVQVRDSIGNFSRVLDTADLLDNVYRQHEAELLAHWNAGARTTVDTRIGYIDRMYGHFGERDYRGVVGQIALNWQASAKMSLNAVASRNVVSFESPDTSYYWLEELRVGPTWDVTSKLKIAATGSVSWRNFGGAVSGSAVGSRSDHVFGARLELDYKPTRYAAIGIFGSISQQTGDLVESAYKDRIVGLTASLTF